MLGFVPVLVVPRVARGLLLFRRRGLVWRPLLVAVRPVCLPLLAAAQVGPQLCEQEVQPVLRLVRLLRWAVMF